MDELYTFTVKKREKAYLWSAIAVTKTKRYYYFYYLSRDKSSGALFNFKDDLPQVDVIYTDGNYAYDSIFGSKATMKKSAMTNIIENLNSQIRDKISYLVRKTKAHSKSFDWLDKRIAWFFVNKNINKDKK
jgi:IS1 family transposase